VVGASAAAASGSGSQRDPLGVVGLSDMVAPSRVVDSIFDRRSGCT
jgi:hypothetical protein